MNFDIIKCLQASFFLVPRNLTFRYSWNKRGILKIVFLESSSTHSKYSHNTPRILYCYFRSDTLICRRKYATDEHIPLMWIDILYLRICFSCFIHHLLLLLKPNRTCHQQPNNIVMILKKIVSLRKSNFPARNITRSFFLLLKIPA